MTMLEPELDPEPTLLPTLGGDTYVDPAYFVREQDRIFEQMWFCAIRSDDIVEPGNFRTVQIGRESVLISRNRKGGVTAFFNICRHRGATLCTEESGTVRRNFQCPYHAWTYDLDGKLIAAPNLIDMPMIDRVEYGLRKVHVREWLGYVWVCVAEDVPSFEDTVQGDVRERLGGVGAIDSYDMDSLALGRRIVYDVKANWKLIVENFMECYHCATIHPELTEVLPEFADGMAAQTYVGHGAEFGSDIAGFTVDGSHGFDALDGVSEDRDRRYYAITIRPTVFVNLVPDHVIIHRMFPMSADRTVVECDWLYAPAVVADPHSAATMDKSVELFHRVNEQDFEACERCQPAMSSRMYRDGGVLVPAEHHIRVFHDWVGSRVSGPAQ
ncbi:MULTISPECIES: aromatic ring-hydroxylating dioxygenase subunit alpha [unclassified Rhodococcus (in: high G+C Gram-positive bacteria)]|uniref:aromatic ring-hydroxylating oxygenase subunit alpha n=1 Tax=unclassified Rhodococcus (in: high G+C Gram-positive bacteria) TaxID=192944 RepID=UPI000B9A6B16|nr:MULTISPECIES: aromatic ring-hydroxylating dioxygenase subunit alpha [unclassified Rhodococcus (in: high G+C Gram-positive bacteria)]OZE24579.1 2Fe-2S ferredoxin [Rhodococcus sp. 05-2254-6]OZE42192.1 2Fe-2S ferredoxin [Rhodococcus sp. 05-2254-4]OZE49878.1 2Fe-2S ferredoxin [Rhodococcus sp. 05-2254-3]OZE50516.1 2Fe-2S ferredoxin [Rhodococcus sp. 05-2254-2]